MRLSHLALAAALVFAAFEVNASVVRDDLPRDLISSCLVELRALARDGDSDSPRFDLNEHCPKLAKRIGLSAALAAMGPVEVDAASIEGLRDLQSFAAGFHRQPSPSENFVALDGLLADVLIEESMDDDLWEGLLRWLEQFAGDGESAELKRFLNWLEELDPPPWLADVILKGSVVLILLLALMVIGNELRLAGVMQRIRRPRGLHEPTGTEDTAPKPVAKSLDALAHLPPRQLAAAILEIVTGTLAERGWVSASSSLTNGELVRQINQRQTGLSASFTSLVNGTEKVIYGDRLPDDASRQRLLATARKLIARARGASTVASGGSG